MDEKTLLYEIKGTCSSSRRSGSRIAPIITISGDRDQENALLIRQSIGNWGRWMIESRAIMPIYARAIVKTLYRNHRTQHCRRTWEPWEVTVMRKISTCSSYVEYKKFHGKH